MKYDKDPESSEESKGNHDMKSTTSKLLDLNKLAELEQKGKNIFVEIPSFKEFSLKLTEIKEAEKQYKGLLSKYQKDSHSFKIHNQNELDEYLEARQYFRSFNILSDDFESF